jgi:hypothetical protein
MSRKGKKRKPPASESLSRLPLGTTEIWQVGVVRFPGWLAEGDSDPVRPWVTLVADRARRTLLHHKLEIRLPDADAVWRAITSAMRSPQSGPPRRPQAVELAADAHASDLSRRLSEVGVAACLSESLDAIEDVSGALLWGLEDHGGLWALIDVPGLSHDALARFYDVTASFHELAPWEVVPSDMPLRIDCPLLDDGPWYAVVIGQEGTPGIAIYRDLDFLRSLILDGLRDEEAALRTTGTSMVYSRAHEISIRDLEAIESFGWRVDGEEAYPLVMQLKASEPPRCPTALELEQLETCMLGCMRFVQHGLASPGSFESPLELPEADMVIGWNPV